MPVLISKFRLVEGDDGLRAPKNSPWGAVTCAIELGCGLYGIFTENGEGMALSPQAAKRTLPAAVGKLGILFEGMLYFSDSDAVFESAARYAAEIICAYRQRAELLLDAHLRMRALNDVCSLTLSSPKLEHSSLVPLFNGIYAVYSLNRRLLGLAVHTRVCDRLMSAPAMNVGGISRGEYLYFFYPNSAVAYFELHFLPQVRALAPARGRLIQTLNSHFKAYVLAYNAISTEPIPLLPG